MVLLIKTRVLLVITSICTTVLIINLSGSVTPTRAQQIPTQTPLLIATNSPSENIQQVVTMTPTINAIITTPQAISPTPTNVSTNIASQIIYGTPTVDPTTTALQKEVLQNQVNNWYWLNVLPLASTIFSALSGIGILITAVVGYFKWRNDLVVDREKREQEYKIDREKRDEERFQSLVEGLGSDKIEARVGAAILLRTFLQPGYEQFYSQAFDLAVAHLRLRKTSPNAPEPLDSLSQALITVLKESFPRARDYLTNNSSHFDPEILDATRVQLDNAYLSRTDLSGIRMREASVRGAWFWKARLTGAYLKHSDLEAAFLVEANLEEADLGNTVLKNANLNNANLQKAHLRHADLSNANLTDANLTGTRPEGARSLQGTILRGVKGLDAGQLTACANRGAIIT